MQHNLGNRKKIVFSILAVTFAFALLAGLELGLRAFHFGADFELVSVEEKGGVKQYRLNPKVGKRYFSEHKLLVPELAPETFSYKKNPQTFRIICLGESTTASFPFEHQARWHCLMRDYLTALHPNRQIEVINAAMSAVNSFTVLDFVRELVHYEPDLFLIYMGHNEFYGALGVGSVQTLGKNRRLINSYLKLQHLKLTQLLRTGIDGLRGALKRSYPALHPEQTLMEMIARNRHIPHESEDFRIAAQSFEANLREVIQIAQQRQIKVIASTQVSNLNGLAPFHSLHLPQLAEDERTNWEKEFTLGKQATQQKQYELALGHFAQAEVIDGNPAELHFEIARAHEALGRYDEARKSYEKARDLDALRFRAPGLFNQIIRQACASLHVPLVEMEQEFSRSSSHGIVGSQLLFEHVHPNFEGYVLMAKSFAQAILDHDLLPMSNSARPDSFIDMGKLSRVTDLDVAIGNVKIARLVQRWPFRAEQFVERPPGSNLDSVVTRLAEDYVNRRLAWEEAHYRVAEHYEKRGEYERAEQEYLSVTRVLPENYYPHFRLANLYYSQNRYAEAESALQEALKRNSRSALALAKLGMLKFARRDYGAARDQFERALSVNLETHELTDSGLSSANYYLALAFLQTGSLEEALHALQETLRWQPGHAEARRLIELIQSNQPVQLEF